MTTRARRLRDRWDRRVTIALSSCVLLAAVAANRPDDVLAVLLDSEGVAANLITTDTLSAPTSVTADDSTAGQIDLSWTATVDTYAGGYNIYRSDTQGSGYTYLDTVSGQSTASFSDSTLGTVTHYYVVESYADSWTSTYSNEASGTPIHTGYLHDDPTPPSAGSGSSSPLTINSTVPTASTLQNYDSDRDSDAGLWLVQSSLGLSETDTTMYQLWQQSIASPVDLEGTATIYVTAAMMSFNTTHAGTLEAWLLDCNGAGASCTTLGSGSLTRSPWNASAAWYDASIDLGAVSHRIVAGRTLQVRLVVSDSSGDDMWLAYDTTAYPSRLVVE